MKYLKYIGKKANKASESLKYVSHDKIQKTLRKYIELLKKNELKIIKQNLKDLKKNKRKNLNDRLLLDKKRIHNMRRSLKEIIKFIDSKVEKFDYKYDKNKILNHINKLKN